MFKWTHQNIFSVRGELYKRYRWIVVIYESFETLPRRRIPYTTKSIITAGDNLDVEIDFMNEGLEF